MRQIATLAILVIGLCVLCCRDPRVAHSYPPCPFFFITHHYCPGCGAMRAVYSLLHADIVKALDYNALLVIFVPLLLYAAVYEVVELTTGRGLRRISVGRLQGRLIVLVVFAFWLLRNIPVYPFTLLAP